MFKTLKQIIKKLMRTIKSTKGNSLAEFAVTTAMMATLATTAAPKFGQVGAGAKEKKTIANLDKILTVANNYYNQTLSEEGKGRFPGQEKYDVAVGGVTLADGAQTDETLEAYIETILENKVSYESDLSEFVYVFSTATDDDDATQGGWMNLETSVGFDGNAQVGALDFKEDFGNNGIESPFQDGSYAYLVIPGSGSGTDAQAPVMVVIDTENPSKMHKTLVP
jgi:hypothetical protein|tara:strand:+ start:1141 stop:1809 length:669 start_codon:yes stop_codon:yes gene_type:complete